MLVRAPSHSRAVIWEDDATINLTISPLLKACCTPDSEFSASAVDAIAPGEALTSAPENRSLPVSELAKSNVERTSPGNADDMIPTTRASCLVPAAFTVRTSPGSSASR